MMPQQKQQVAKRGTEMKASNTMKGWNKEDGPGNDSAKYVHGTLSVLVSEIFFQRGLLSSRHFTPIRVHKIRAPIMAGVTRQGKAFWVLMNGVLDAIRKRYLHKMLVVISEKGREDTSAMEVYKFSIKYTEDGCCIVSRNSQGGRTSVVMYKGKDELRKQVVALLREVHEVTTSLEKLPKRAAPLIKLTYYPDVPPNYEPEGFERAETLYRFDEIPSGRCLGSFHCEMLSCKLKLESLYHGSPMRSSRTHHSVKKSEGKTDGVFAHETKKSNICGYRRTSAIRPPSRHQNSETNSMQAAFGVGDHLMALPDSEQYGGSVHESIVFSDEILAGNLKNGRAMQRFVLTDDLKELEKQNRKEKEATDRTLNRPSSLNIDTATGNKFGSPKTNSSDSFSNASDRSMGAVTSKNIQPLGSCSLSNSTDQEGHDHDGSTGHISAKDPQQKVSPKRPHSSPSIIVLSSSDSSYVLQTSSVDELHLEKRQKVSRINHVPFKSSQMHCGDGALGATIHRDG